MLLMRMKNAYETKNCGGLGMGFRKEEKEAHVKDVAGLKTPGEIKKSTELQKSEELKDNQKQESTSTENKISLNWTQKS